MDILAYTMEEIIDPTQIIDGERFEFMLDIKVDEDDELYTEGGLEIRAIVAKKDDETSLANYFITTKANQELLDFALEDEEEEMIFTCCKEHIAAGD